MIKKIKSMAIVALGNRLFQHPIKIISSTKYVLFWQDNTRSDIDRQTIEFFVNVLQYDQI